MSDRIRALIITVKNLWQPGPERALLGRLLGGVFLEALALFAVFIFAYPIPLWEQIPLVLSFVLAVLVVFGGSCLVSAPPLARLALSEEGGRKEAVRRLSRLPFRLLFLRPVLWTLGVLPGVFWLVSGEVLPWEAAWLLPNLTMGGTILSGALVSLLVRRVVNGLVPEEDREERIWHYATTLHEFLLLVSIAMASVGVVVARLMYHAILGITVVHFRKNAEFAPLVGIVLGLLWLGVISWWSRGPRRFLLEVAQIPEEKVAEQPTGRGRSYFFTPPPGVGSVKITRRLPEAIRTYQVLQALPYRIAVGSFAVWFLANAGTTILHRYWFGASPEDVLLMLTLGSILACCLALYALSWHRSEVRIGMRYLSSRFRIPLEQVRGQLSIRTRIAATFGGLLIFACLAALLSTLSQFRRASTALVAEQGRTRAEELAYQLMRSLPEEDPWGWALSQLKEISRTPEEVVVLFPPRGEPGVLGELSQVERLREYLEAAPAGSSLELSELGLAGGYARLGGGGVLVVLLPTGRVPGLERSLLILLGFFLLLTTACLGVVVAAARDLTTPLGDLAEEASVIARGDLTRRIPLGETDEIGDLTQAFDMMRESLARNIREIQILNASLEDKVKARTQELEKKRQELEAALHQLKEAQTQLVQSEKMASLGFLVAGIAHDLNNPINFVRNNIDPLAEITRDLVGVVRAYQEAAVAFEEDRPDAEDLLSEAERRARGLNLEETERDLAELLRMLRNGADRTAKIVASLKTFSRVGESRQKDADLHQGLDETLELLGYHFRQHQITIQKEYGDLGLVTCDAGALNQVFMNLLTNAIDALKHRESPRITLKTHREGEWAVLEIEDNGQGIPEEITSRIFEPFFTTKDTGQGTGLGLSISRRIVMEHGGTLSVLSTPGEFTRFTIKLPLRGKGAGRPGHPEAGAQNTGD